MWPSEWIRGREAAIKELERWSGARAQVWSYKVSHSQFLVRLHRVEKSTTPLSLYLYMKCCHRVAFSDYWDNAAIQIEERPGKYGPEFFVSDGEHLFVHCGAVFAAEADEFVSTGFQPFPQ